MISPIRKKDSEVVSLIHLETLSNDFLPSLGFNFLKTFYDGVIGKPQVFGFVAKEKREIVGFVVGTDDMSEFFRLAIRSKFLPLSYYLFIQIIKKPTIIKNILETLLYPNKESGPPSELVVIAVDSNAQGKGIGRKLVSALEKEMRRRKIKEYKLTVTKRNKNANSFYKKLDFKLHSSFNLYDKAWNLLVKKV